MAGGGRWEGQEGKEAETGVVSWAAAVKTRATRLAVATNRVFGGAKRCQNTQGSSKALHIKLWRSHLTTHPSTHLRRAYGVV